MPLLDGRGVPVTIRAIAEWFVSTFHKASGRFGNVSVTAVHVDRGRLTGVTVRKKTMIRSGSDSVTAADHSPDRIKKAVELIIQHFEGLRASHGDADLTMDVIVQGGTVRQVSVMETRNLSAERLDSHFSVG